MHTRRRRLRAAWLGATFLSAGGSLCAQSPAPLPANFAGAPAVALTPQPLPSGVPLSGTNLTPVASEVQPVGFFGAKVNAPNSVPPPLADAPPPGPDLLPKVTADAGSKPAGAAMPPVPYVTQPMSPMTAPTWRWYGWGATNPHGPVPAAGEPPVAPPPPTGEPAPPPPAAPDAKSALPAWSPAPVSTPPATNMRLAQPQSPMPAPPVAAPMADPLTGARVPQAAPELAAAGGWKAARASSRN